MNDALAAAAALMEVSGFGWLLWRYGLDGCWQGIKKFLRPVERLIYRLAHGPDPVPARRADPDYIRRLQRELGIPEDP